MALWCKHSCRRQRGRTLEQRLYKHTHIVPHCVTYKRWPHCEVDTQRGYLRLMCSYSTDSFCCSWGLLPNTCTSWWLLLYTSLFIWHARQQWDVTYSIPASLKERTLHTANLHRWVDSSLQQLLLHSPLEVNQWHSQPLQFVHFLSRHTWLLS